MAPDQERSASECVPNPGSRAATASGCLCAIMDNNNGAWPPWPPDGWYVTEGCPLHWDASDSGSDVAQGQDDG